MKTEMNETEMFTPKTKHYSKYVVKDIGEAMVYLLERKNEVTAQDIVNLARPTNSKIHKHFEWNNTKAGERYRESQARIYLSWIEITVNEKGKNRAFVNVQRTGERRGYVLINTALSEPSLRKQLLFTAMREAEYWANQYKTLAELRPIFKAVQLVKRKIKR